MAENSVLVPYSVEVCNNKSIVKKIPAYLEDIKNSLLILFGNTIQRCIRFSLGMNEFSTRTRLRRGH